MLLLSFVVASLALLSSPAHAQWSLDSTPLWADFGHNGVQGNTCPGTQCVLSDTQAHFLANTYKIISLEKCFGIKWGTPGSKTEINFIQAVRQLKAANPNVTVLLYWNVPMVIAECYDTAAIFMDHPDWWLHDDKGQVVRPDGNPDHLYIDFTVPEAAQWWVDVPLQLVDTAGADGVFLDGTSGQDYTGSGVSQARSDAVNKAAVAAMVAYRTSAKHLRSDLMVIGNGLVEYPFPPDHGMSTLAFLDGVCIEHFGAFEGVDNTNGSLIPANLRLWAQLTAQVVALNKSVLVKTWVGPETTPIDGMGPFWPSSHQPPLANRTHTAIAQAAAANLLFPHSIFLCIVDRNVYMNYAWWYDLMQGYVPCPETPGGCDTPDEFYPTLSNRVGEPKSAGVWSGYVCQRDFDHASVYVDLANPASARITWK